MRQSWFWEVHTFIAVLLAPAVSPPVPAPSWPPPQLPQVTPFIFKFPKLMTEWQSKEERFVYRFWLAPLQIKYESMVNLSMYSMSHAVLSMGYTKVLECINHSCGLWRKRTFIYRASVTFEMHSGRFLCYFSYPTCKGIPFYSWEKVRLCKGKQVTPHFGCEPRNCP